MNIFGTNIKHQRYFWIREIGNSRGKATEGSHKRNGMKNRESLREARAVFIENGKGND